MIEERSKYCGLVGEEDLGKEVTLFGWVHRVRDHGGVIFIDLRDREGIVQLVVEEVKNPKVYKVAKSLRNEFVVKAKGRVRRRPEGTENPKLKTGYFEVLLEDLKVLSESKVLPFPVEEETKVSEELKLKYRYLDLRRESVKKNLLFRHEFYQKTRKFFLERGFVEVETPYLTKSTPEGARDFLVPSRLQRGKFYALPQSPQLFKQILMVAGFDRYFQIVKCFRDEDLRADRQPEFTQVDFEMSFVDEEDVMNLVEEYIEFLFFELLGIRIKRPFYRISYGESLKLYGTDKPDRRIPLILYELSEIFKETKFKVFSEALKGGGVIKALKVPKKLSRREIDEVVSYAQRLGAKGLAWIKVENGKLNSPIVKFFSEEEVKGLTQKTKLKEGEVLFFLADRGELVNKVLSQLREHLGKELRREGWDFLWVIDFPLFEWDEEEGRFVSLHHPFTAPKEEDVPLLEDERTIPLVRSRAYDLVINGEEVGGGSIRIKDSKLQRKIFKILNIPEEEVERNFGFLLEALDYGAPPHGGFALGLDRMVALMLGLDSIRDVIAFPKTQKGTCPLTSAPDYVEERQLKELSIKTDA